MRTGLRPPRIGQIFASVPAARSRCLSAFIAIARQGLPLPLRYEPSHILGLGGVVLLTVGFITDPVNRFGGPMIAAGWGTLGLALFAHFFQHKLVYGQSRPRLIRQLDEVRMNVGLDDVILPESLEFLEAAAQQWERIEHVLQAQVWRDQEPLRLRIQLAAHKVMEDIVVLECGSTAEVGLSDSQADDALTTISVNLRWLADQVDATGAAITTYPRPGFESNGMEPEGVLPELDRLEEALRRLGHGKDQ